MEKTYSLIQSEDLACSVIDISTIIKPRKDLESYREGEYIVARFKGREYSAVINEIGHDRTDLDKKIKEGKLKFHYVNRKSDTDISMDGNAEVKETVMNRTDKKASVIVAVEENEGESPAKKKKISENKKKNEKMTEEDKKVAAEENKKRRDNEQDRINVQNEMSKKILHKTVQSKFDDEVKKSLERLEEKVDTLSNLMDTFIGCKMCMRKAYKKLSQSSLPNFVSSPFLTSKQQPAMAYTIDSLCASPLPQLPLPSIPVEDSSGTKFFARTPGLQGQVSLWHDDNGKQKVLKMTLDNVESGSSISSNSDLIFLGDAVFIMSQDEINNQTVYGSAQHNLKPMDPQKREALRSCIFSRYKEEKNTWGNVVKAINDKIRKKELNQRTIDFMNCKKMIL